MTGYKRFINLLLFGGLCLAAVSVSAQPDRVQEMNREIAVIEEVFDEVFDDDFDNVISSPAISSAFIEDYGAVFQIRISARKYRGEEAVNARRNYDRMKQSLKRAFPAYISRIRGFNPNDNITVIVYPSQSSILRNYSGRVVSGSPYAEEKFEPSGFVLSSKRSDLRSDSPERVVSEFELDGNGYAAAGTREDIRILSSILERSIEDGFSTSISSSGVQGAYIKGYGALFTVRTGDYIISSNARVSLPAEADIVRTASAAGTEKIQVAIDIPDHLIERAIALRERESNRETVAERRNNIVAEIVRVLGTYGSTIAGVGRDEKITVCFTSGNVRWDRLECIKTMVTLTYGDAERYNRGQMSEQQLLNTAEIVHLTDIN